MQVRALGRAKAAFEIHRPDLVGAARHRQRWQGLRRSTPWPGATAGTQAQLSQPAAHRGYGGTGARRQDRVDLLGTPSPMLQTKLTHLLPPMCQTAPAMMMRCPAAQLQAGLTLGLIASTKLVTGLPAETKAPAQSRKVDISLLHSMDKFLTPLHQPIPIS